MDKMLKNEFEKTLREAKREVSPSGKARYLLDRLSTMLLGVSSHSNNTGPTLVVPYPQNDPSADQSLFRFLASMGTAISAGKTNHLRFNKTEAEKQTDLRWEEYLAATGITPEEHLSFASFLAVVDGHLHLYHRDMLTKESTLQWDYGAWSLEPVAAAS